MTPSDAAAKHATAETMRAWTLHAFGRSNLQLSEIDKPRPQADEALIRIRAFSLNYRDKLVIEGGLLPQLPTMPFTPISDMAGEVVAVGENVSRIRPGARVAGHFRTTWIEGKPTRDTSNPDTTLGGPLPGVASEYMVLPEHALVELPDALSFADGATLPIAALTAWMALDAQPGPRRHETVLVQGTGGVSLFALQFAQAMGHRVILTSRSDEKLARAKTLGSFDGVNTQSHPNWAEEVLSLTDRAGVDRIVEVVGGANLGQSLDALAIGGTVSQVGFLDGIDLSFAAVPLMLKHATIKGISVGDRKSFESMLAFMARHKIKPVIEETYSFESLASALDHLDRGAFGKIVVAGWEG
ncbi:zinc-dependent alcohol dehydrogenase family protein [Qipengyuania sp.]|uniref:zinc-dependent alcohol dehydrogenase family protein n=1 Tax=Qipengyuania sp. TaxID=2004515 RepID=UPI003BABAABA